MKNLLTEKFSKILLILGLLILVSVTVLFLWNDSNIDTGSKIKADKIGQFGDFVGGLIGSMWALAGVIMFYVALKEQRKDFSTNKEVLAAQVEALKLQIKEFELQRAELKETREVFKIQSNTLKTQQFESTLFNLLNLHHQIVNSIDLQTVEDKYKGFDKLKQLTKNQDEKIQVNHQGRDCFVLFKNKLIREYEFSNGENEIEKIERAYGSFFEYYQSDLGHYYRNLYHIFKFIHNSNVRNKKVYTSIVRAQLSNDELLIIFYNCLTDYGKEKFKPLVEEYQLLKNLNRSTLIDEKEHFAMYDLSAFEK